MKAEATRLALCATVAICALLFAFVSPAEAQYFRRPVSVLDPNLMLIDEKAVLGAKMNPAMVLVDQDGKEFTWGSVLDKPVLLVLSYFTCDGTCSIINSNLAALLKDVKSVTAGSDFRIVTISFDRHDTLQTTGAFRRHIDLAGPLKDNWTFATFKNEADLKSEIDKIGFRFFWSPEDRVFLHPGAFLFFSPEGRMIRVLYQEEVDARDIELAVLDARQGNFRPHEVINFVLSLCYSYSYHDGKYVMSIPIIVGVGALAFGLSTLFGSMYLFRNHKRTERTGENDYVEAA